MGVNKVVINTDNGEEVLVNLTDDSVTPDALFDGITAHSKSGDRITGTFTLAEEMSTQDTLIAQIAEALEGKAGGSGGGGGIKVSTTNLHNVNTDILNMYLSNGKDTAYNGWDATDYIPVKADKYYFIYSKSAVEGKWSARYNTDKGYTGVLPSPCCTTNKTSPFLLKGNDGYIRFSGTRATVSAIEMYEVTGLNWEV